MRAIIVDPWNQTVYPTDEKSWSLDKMYEHLSGPDGFRKCNDINSVRLGRSEILWVDGEGLLIPSVPVWSIKGYTPWLAGKALILGIDEEGSNQASILEVPWVKDMVLWTNLITTGELGPSRSEGNTFHMGQPILKEKE